MSPAWDRGFGRRPWSVVLIGVESGNISPPMSFLRFTTEGEAQEWIDSTPATVHPLTFWRPIRIGPEPRRRRSDGWASSPVRFWWWPW